MVYRLIIHHRNLQLQSYMNSLTMFSPSDVCDKIDWLLFTHSINRTDVSVKLEHADEVEFINGNIFYNQNKQL